MPLQPSGGEITLSFCHTVSYGLGVESVSFLLKGFRLSFCLPPTQGLIPQSTQQLKGGFPLQVDCMSSTESERKWGLHHQERASGARMEVCAGAGAQFTWASTEGFLASWGAEGVGSRQLGDQLGRALGA